MTPLPISGVRTTEACLARKTSGQYVQGHTGHTPLSRKTGGGGQRLFGGHEINILLSV